MKSQENVQKHECQEVRRIFMDAKDPSKVMVVALDTAKTAHKVVVCNGLGDRLCKPFDVRNTYAGLDYLDTRIAGLCGQRHIEKDHVVIGLETPGSWAVNFSDHLLAGGKTVVEIHPVDVAKYQENTVTTHDRIAADTIARCIMQRLGRLHKTNGVLHGLLFVCRHHGDLVRKCTRVKNQMNTVCDYLFPGLIKESETGLTPYSRAVLDLLANVSIARIQRMSLSQLERYLRRRGVKRVAESAQKLKQLAQQALDPDPCLEPMQRQRMKALVEEYRLLDGQIAEAEGTMAKLLRQTPGVMLTSISGIGMVLAAHITAEVYCKAGDLAVDSKVCYSGLTARGHRTGGDDKPMVSRGKNPKVNHYAKRAVLMAAEKVAQYERHDFAPLHERLANNGKNPKYMIGRKLIRFSNKLMNGDGPPEAFIPSHLRNDPELAETILPHYYQELKQKMEAKWQTFRTHKPDPDHDVLATWSKKIKTQYDVTINV